MNNSGGLFSRIHRPRPNPQAAPALQDAPSEYAETFEELGLTVDHGGTEWGTFPFQRVVVAKKPGS